MNRHAPFIPLQRADARQPDDSPESPARRALLGLMAASAALAGAGCSGPPQEAIVPYVDMPEGAPLGNPVFYATAVVRDGYAHGVLVQSREGRPIKVEGNPGHPVSRGATDAYAQAVILQLWDPDRSNAIVNGGDIAAWQAFREALAQRRAAWDRNGGAGLRVLTGTVTSPTLLRQLEALRQRYPAMRWHRHDPLHDAAADAGNRQAWGAPIAPLYRLDRARIVAAYGADLFGAGPGAIRCAGDFMATRGDNPARGRLYVLEAAPTLTGAVADERRALRPDEIEAALRRLAMALQMPGASAQLGETPTAWDRQLAKALRVHVGASLVVAGPGLSAPAHALAWAINAALGNIGETVTALPTPDPAPINALAAEMRDGRVDTLLILDANPVYDTPGAMRFADAMRHVPCSIHLGLYRDETGRAATWHLPRAHDFEDWSDARAADGTASIVQPLIAPLHAGRSPHTLLALLTDDSEITAYQAVRDTWRAAWTGTDLAGDVEARWTESLRTGVVAGSALAPLTRDRLAPPESLWRAAMASPGAMQPDDAPAARRPGETHETGIQPESAPALLALFAADASAGTGAWANNAWLQELPRPLTQITWDNAAVMAPETARDLGVQEGDVVRLLAAPNVHGPEPASLSAPAGTASPAGEPPSIEVPVFILPGQAPGVVSLALGYGRRAAGRVGDGVGVDVYPLAPLDGQGMPQAVARVRVRATGRRHAFARAQRETSMHDREMVRVVPPGERAGEEKTQPSLYPPVDYPDYAWAMTVDLDACIGCKACTVACQAENNIPTVGKEEVARGRIMHWLRVDVYHDERPPQQAHRAPQEVLPQAQSEQRRQAPRTLFQPVPCMHCENAPCEEVCPVGATVHDSEGLNAQVYNRCVGTRFCSNNCPYKVRRFNFYAYSDESESSAARANPEVTVRRRGVMEKCTYCVQRISRARIEAEKAGRAIRDGDVVTACEAACPTRAIVFGDLNDPSSRVNASRRSPRRYALLEELNTRPRTTYLARVEDLSARLESGDG
ncbi:4Fe-4S dicluster domain-containing protein [Bordetella genomosp. 9]|uniref:4Fe-4S ferredoxin-type domain-containing protein n=1 Tax=Bordetella genomosp. 9 TaxID=1416803 RepID=A0A1W6Z296_9BORD|nr:4Fe-4S dicluster domain-containing protein [Bordetella genomosp. 9]ARP87497.1 hypothetical protein CAL13_15750 [Bordetella genomosp. 9]